MREALIYSDNQDQISKIRDYLKKVGIALKASHDQQAFLKILNTDVIDPILFSVEKKDEADFVARIRRLSDRKFLLLSSEPVNPKSLYGHDFTGEDIIEKPFFIPILKKYFVTSAGL